MCATFTDIFLMADGILVASAECLESEAVKAVRGELGLNAVAAGAAVTARAWEKGKAHLADGTIKTFLDAQGKGVLYIAFGQVISVSSITFRIPDLINLQINVLATRSL